MTRKTISGHYGKEYSIKHNNRVFIPKNADASRVSRNYYCIAAGEKVCLDRVLPEHISAYWERYRHICDLYWEQRAIYRKEEMQKYYDWLREMRRYFWLSFDPSVALFQLLLAPLFAPLMVTNIACYYRVKKELERQEFELWVRDICFKQKQISMREALKAYDCEHATTLLFDIDDLVTEMVAYDEHGCEIVAWDFTIEEPLNKVPQDQLRFATIEEIYAKCFEPSFRTFQNTQRPCRRYEGTYLEQVRERQENAEKTKGSKTEKNRAVAEAIEVVFTIGDMDSTGYRAAPHDAEKAEAILKDLCDHLLQDPHLCYVTTKELNDPHWEPPFKHGLIVLNAVAHFDEATPGVHLTCIPYSRGCKRGPDAQASLGRAMAGMGYPSTWKEVLGEDGKPIPKCDRSGNVILNSDGTVRYQQEPDKQGIVDWIEDQKKWIAQEMEKRYGWEREYKGSHPRGHLSTPDYQVARAQERLAETEKVIKFSEQAFEDHVKKLAETLVHAASSDWVEVGEKEVLMQYLLTCPDERYEQLLNEAACFLKGLPFDEQAEAIKNFQETLLVAQKRAESQNKQQDKRPLQEVGR